jgi:L-histidine N-alpha-methyltransferase
LRLLELGAGTAAKTGILLEAATRSRNEVIYIPVDVSPDALDDACESIGNFSPQEVRTILRNLRSELRAGDALLLGTDMVRDEATLVRVYDDEAGVTVAFNLNILHRLNRYKFTQKTLGALLDDAGFTIEQRWSDPRGWYALTLAGLQY